MLATRFSFWMMGTEKQVNAEGPRARTERRAVLTSCKGALRHILGSRRMGETEEGPRDVCAFLEVEAPFLQRNGGGRSGQTTRSRTGTDMEHGTWMTGS